MMAKFLNVIVASLLISFIECTDKNVCVPKNSCLCEFSEFSKIDLSQVIEGPQNATTFLETRKNNTLYFFHGCTNGDFIPKDHGINLNSTSSVKASLVVGNATNITLTATTSQIKFNRADDNEHAYELAYQNGSTLVATVRLICDNFNEPFIQVLPPKSQTIRLVLSSPHACIVTHHPGLSTGSVLLILFIVAVAIYFICGGLILYFIRGARGVELIPNIDFWRELPGLIKDGVIFLFSGCNASRISTPDTYDKI